MKVEVNRKETRSKNRRGIKNRDTKPELRVRRLLHRNGYRFRVAPARLPGKPDIWLAKWNTAIFVNGCFWHMHDCGMFELPRTRTEFWKTKLESNVVRDREVIEKLSRMGIRKLIVWECALKGRNRLPEHMLVVLIKTWLISNQNKGEITSAGMVITS